MTNETSVTQAAWAWRHPSFHFMTPDAGGEGGGGAGGGTPPPATPPNPELIPKAEAQKAFAARDAAKAGVKQFATMLGIDPEAVKITATGDAANPYRLEAEGLDETVQLLQQARANKPKPAKWEERETELTKAHQKQLKDANDAAAKKLSIYGAYVDNVAVQAEIREALIAEGAIDADGSGSYNDLVTLLKPRIKATQEIDEESGLLRVKKVALDEKGQPMLDGAGNPAGVRAAVADFLGKRPAYRQANRRSGPGAGGAGPQRPGQQQGAILAPADRGKQASAYLFGKGRRR